VQQNDRVQRDPVSDASQTKAPLRSPAKMGCLRRMAQMRRRDCALPIKGPQGYGAAQSDLRANPLAHRRHNK
jgi:hypothetical protein